MQGLAFYLRSKTQAEDWKFSIDTDYEDKTIHCCLWGSDSNHKDVQVDFDDMDVYSFEQFIEFLQFKLKQIKDKGQK